MLIPTHSMQLQTQRSLLQAKRGYCTAIYIAVAIHEGWQSWGPEGCASRPRIPCGEHHARLVRAGVRGSAHMGTARMAPRNKRGARPSHRASPHHQKGWTGMWATWEATAWHHSSPINVLLRAGPRAPARLSPHWPAAPSANESSPSGTGSAATATRGGRAVRKKLGGGVGPPPTTRRPSGIPVQLGGAGRPNSPPSLQKKSSWLWPTPKGTAQVSGDDAGQPCDALPTAPVVPASAPDGKWLGHRNHPMSGDAKLRWHWPRRPKRRARLLACAAPRVTGGHRNAFAEKDRSSWAS